MTTAKKPTAAKKSTKKKEDVAHATWHVVTQDEHPVYVTGSIQELGEWNPHKALQLQHGGRGQDAHHWNIGLTFPRGLSMEFKFIHKSDDGEILWEAGENRVFTAEEAASTTEWGLFRTA